jgi:hypothetical protein
MIEEVIFNRIALREDEQIKMSKVLNDIAKLQIEENIIQEWAQQFIHQAQVGKKCLSYCVSSCLEGNKSSPKDALENCAL